jgi:hypothetical protein
MLIACRPFDCTVSNGSLSEACAETVGARRHWLGKAANMSLVQLLVLFILQENMVSVQQILDVVRRIDRGEGTGRYLIALFKLQKS